MQSLTEKYRTKAREFARLAAIAKSRPDARYCRMLADMYWALALGDETKLRTMAPIGVRAASDDLAFRSLHDHVKALGNAAQRWLCVSPRAFR